VSRPAESWATVAASLHRVIADAPEWASSEAEARAWLARARADVLALLERDGPSQVAADLGVDRSTLHRWRTPGGWLNPRGGA
jgi:hypothetical protein